MRLLFLYIIFQVSFIGQGQNKKSVYCDCAKAKTIEILDSILIGPTEAPKCSGIQEINFSDKKSFEKEHNTAWFILNIRKCGLLSFTVMPEKNTDDYDFMVFKLDSANTCKRIKDGLQVPLRSNISRNDSSGLGETGLKETANNDFSAKGINSNYSKALEVKDGEKYILVMDNVYDGGKGFTIRFKNDKLNYFKFNPIDYYSKKPLRTDRFYYDSAAIFCQAEWADLSFDTKIKIKIPWENCLNKKGPLKFIRISAKGYLPEFLVIDDNIYENNDVKVQLKKIVKDSVYSFKNIFFNPDLSVNMMKSNISIIVAQEFFKKNPKSNIVVQQIGSGFIKTDEDLKKAVSSLVKQICNNGIPTNRIKVLNQTSVLIKEGEVTFKAL